MPNSVPPSFDGFAFIGSLAIMAQFSFRSKTLRRRVFPVLRFGWLVDLDQQRSLILDAELCAVPFRGFCFYR
jgi:hypothetical protein